MPPSQEPRQKTQLPSLPAAEKYPLPAYEFIHEGLDYTVQQVHGQQTAKTKKSRHVSGQQLCYGLRDLAQARWGRLARTVLRHWNINNTLDFGKIVFSLIEGGQMQKVDEDTLDDFKNVYDLDKLEAQYRIPLLPSKS